MKILLDMDGVLSDFVGGVCSQFGIRGSVDHCGQFDLAKTLGISENAMWSKVDHYDFWMGLQEMPDAREILRICTKYISIENICILTSPALNPLGAAGKIQWIKNHFPEFSRRFLLGPAKQFCCSPDNILVDDYERNVALFGRNGVLVPRPWNCHNVVSDLELLETSLALVVR